MYHKHHTNGIVLGSRFEGEHNKIIQIFTKDFGLVSVKAQAVRGSQSKLRMACQDFSVGNFSLLVGRNSWKLVGAESIKNIFEELKYSEKKLNVVSNIFRLIKRLVGESEPNMELFMILDNFFDFLIKTEEEFASLAECLVLLKILHNLGYMRNDPELSIPMSSLEIAITDLEKIAPKRSHIVNLINESIKATNLT